MKKIISLVVFIGILFSGCGKYEPTLPKSYDNVSFLELMQILGAKEQSQGRYSLYLLDSNNTHINDAIYNLCKSKKGYIQNDGVGTYKGFKYCNLKDEILFGYWIYRDYYKNGMYKYWFNNNSQALKIEFNKEKLVYDEKEKIEEAKYKKYLKKVQKEYKEKARIKKLKEQEKIRFRNNRKKLDYMFIEKFNKPSTEELKNGYVETTTFSTIDRYEFKHHNGNIPDIVFHKQCDKVCSKYNHNLKNILDGNPTLVNKEPFTRHITSQAKYGMYYFDVSCICFGNKYKIKEYIRNGK